MKTNYGYITVRGQTAPEPVIFTGEETALQSSHIILEHLRFRTGYKWPPSAGYQNRDCLNFGHPDPSIETAYILVRNCSMSWGVDECVTVGQPNTHDITVQNCLIAEGLYKSKHPEGIHSMGFLVQGIQKAGVERNVSFHHNIIASCNQRSPLISGAGTVDFRNNLIMNWGLYPSQFASNIYSFYPIRSLNKINYVGNYLIPGTSSVALQSHTQPILIDRQDTLLQLYVHDNKGPHLDPNEEQWNGVVFDIGKERPPEEEYRTLTPHPAPSVTTICPEQTYDYLVTGRGAGASLPEYDATDLRLFREIEQRSLSIKDRPPEDLIPSIPDF
jgi:hypothetical protein